MLPSTAARLADMRESAERIVAYLRERSFEDFMADPVLRDAPERRIEIIGEAMRAVLREDHAAVAGIADARRIAAFRNSLAHEYAMVSDYTVWAFAQERVPRLLTEVETILATAEEHQDQS
jgi:uncharacterized protein with HEPN domain